MNKFTAFLLIFLALSCSDSNNNRNSILPNIPVNETIFLNNPQYLDLQVVGGWSYTKGGISGIILYHYSIDGYIAFDRAAPHLTPKTCSQMIVKNSIKMFCSCDNSEFNLLNGAPLTTGIDYPAKEYRVIVNGNTLQITNF